LGLGRWWITHGLGWRGSWEYIKGLDEYEQTTWRGIEWTLGPILAPDIFLGMEFHAYKTNTQIIPFGPSDQPSEQLWDMILEAETLGQANLMLTYGSQFLD